MGKQIQLDSLDKNNRIEGICRLSRPDVTHVENHTSIRTTRCQSRPATRTEIKAVSSADQYLSSAFFRAHYLNKNSEAFDTFHFVKCHINVSSLWLGSGND